MAELAQGSQELSLHKPAGVGLARARIIWASKPLGFLCLVLWVLHPAVADQTDYSRTMLIALIWGVLYGLLIYGNVYASFVRLRQQTIRTQPNRFPNEYYWGHIEKVLRSNH